MPAPAKNNTFSVALVIVMFEAVVFVANTQKKFALPVVAGVTVKINPGA